MLVHACGELSGAIYGVDEHRNAFVRCRVDLLVEGVNVGPHLIDVVVELLGDHQVIHSVPIYTTCAL